MTLNLIQILTVACILRARGGTRQHDDVFYLNVLYIITYSAVDAVFCFMAFDGNASQEDCFPGGHSKMSSSQQNTRSITVMLALKRSYFLGLALIVKNVMQEGNMTKYLEL